MTDAEWEAHIQSVLQGLWERSRRGLGFNLFTRGTEDFQPADVRGRPGDVGDAGARAHFRVRSSRCATARRCQDFTVLVRRGR